MNIRDVKAVKLTGDMRISFKDGEWLVPSQTSASTRYTVNPSLAAPSCTCDDFRLRQQPCKHIESVRLLLDRQIKGEPPPVRRHWPTGRSLALLLHFPTPALSRPCR
jgi:hypothetical protein